jgi:hypothetical protein
MTLVRSDAIQAGVSHPRTPVGHFQTKDQHARGAAC